MNFNKLRKPFNGWHGQALIEYHVMYPLMAIAIIVLVVFGSQVAATYQKVNDCFEGATQGTAAENCGGEEGGNSQPPEDNSTGSTTGSSTGSSTGSTTGSSTGSTTGSSTGSTTGSSTGSTTGSSTGSTTGSSTGSTTGSSTGTSSGTSTASSTGSTTGEIIRDDEDPDDEDGGDGSETTQCVSDLNFDGLPAGTTLENAIPGVSITTNRPGKPAMIFDTSHPTGGDTDLGTPHSDFGGPGHGSGGGQGQAGENNTALGNVVIISEDGDANDPDDNANGGIITFDFDCPTNLSYVYILDQDTGAASDIILYDENDNVIHTASVNLPPGGGDNGVFRVDLNISGVHKMEVNLPGSGAVASVFFDETAPPADANGGSSTGSSTGSTTGSSTGSSSGSSQPTTGVTGFTLINANNSTVMGAITNGQTINLGPGRSIRAETNGSVGSVRFTMNGSQVRTESAVPYAINGDSNGSYAAWSYPSGTYTLTGTAYSQSGGNGSVINTYSVTITIP